ADFGGGDNATRGPSNFTDLIDLSEPDPHWEPGADMPAAKMYVNAVILPDGKVLETGGAEYNYTPYAVMESSIYDPVTDSFQSIPTDPIARMYHSEAILLPDGRVATVGSQPGTGEFELGISIYSPWYVD
nr:galactose oxidase [Micromonospora sp. DSM 115978]